MCRCWRRVTPGTPQKSATGSTCAESKRGAWFLLTLCSHEYGSAGHRGRRGRCTRSTSSSQRSRTTRDSCTASSGSPGSAPTRRTGSWTWTATAASSTPRSPNALPTSGCPGRPRTARCSPNPHAAPDRRDPHPGRRQLEADIAFLSPSGRHGQETLNRRLKSDLDTFKSLWRERQVRHAPRCRRQQQTTLRPVQHHLRQRPFGRPGRAGVGPGPGPSQAPGRTPRRRLGYRQAGRQPRYSQWRPGDGPAGHREPGPERRHHQRARQQGRPRPRRRPGSGPPDQARRGLRGRPSAPRPRWAAMACPGPGATA